jgi:hypothetical protein
MKRIQRRRTKGWRMPSGAVVVDRSTKWGNPFVVGVSGTVAECVDLYRKLIAGYICLSCRGVTAGELIDYRRFVVAHLDELRSATALVCWCRLDQACHADVLIELLEAAA